MHFLQWRFRIFDSNFTWISPKGLIVKNSAFASSNGMAPNRRQAITWTNDDQAIYASLGLIELTRRCNPVNDRRRYICIIFLHQLNLIYIYIYMCVCVCVLQCGCSGRRYFPDYWDCSCIGCLHWWSLVRLDWMVDQSGWVSVCAEFWRVIEPIGMGFVKAHALAGHSTNERRS